MAAPPAPDFRKLFESAPGLYLVLQSDFTIVAVSDAYARATMTERQAILGRGIFDVFPDNPDDPAADGVRKLRASLERVRKHCKADTMPVQKYDIRKPDSEGGGFEVHYWSPTNSPVMDNGKLAYIIHRVEDVSEFIRLKQRDSEQSLFAEGLRTRAQQIEAEIYHRSQEVAATNQSLRQEYDDTTALLRAVTDGVDDVILVKDLEGRYLTINPGGARLMQASIEAVIGCDDRQFLDADTAERIRAHDLRVIAEGVAHTYEEEIVSAGTARTFLTVKAPHRDGSGKIIGLIGISRDITERKRAEEEIRLLNTELEQRVADRIAELESANHELEAFSYSVSHDLRAPLRGMDGFAQALAEDYGEKLDETGMGYLHRIRAATKRMSELIDGMLELSRIARHEMISGTVDLSAVAGDVAADLHKADPVRSGIEWALAKGMTVQGDPRLLRVVLDNLLGNAWKYSSKHERARIEFASFVRAEDGVTVYFVKDDGAGFDMNYSSKLFGTFQRMHGMTEFPGHGVGLATVQRIVRRHGGKIWASAEIEKGATFFFTLWETGRVER